MTGAIVELFAGPGGFSTGAEMIGLGRHVGIEYDAAACATRAAAGHKTIRADVAAFPVEQLRALAILAIIGSPPCTTFSAAGDQAGNLLHELLAQLIGLMIYGHDHRAAARARMAAALTASPWLADKPPGQRAAKIAAAVTSAALVAEPARYIHAARPEWVALEQVPAVLPLWEVYAAHLRALGYSAWCGILNAADYGVPQTRQRAILIASRVRAVRRPGPTHYDPRKGMQLWGTQWVSMADALGWGAIDRPIPTVTAGGTATGGAEPLARSGREALEAERDRGRWTLRTSFGTPSGDRTGTHEMDPAERPAHAVTTKARSWSLRSHQTIAGGPRAERAQDEPSVTIVSSSRSAQWVLRHDDRANATVRSPDDPAATLHFGNDPTAVAWVRERPATTVQCDPRIGRPGHKDRDHGESQFAQDSVRITPAEAAALQSFPPGYPFQGTKTKQFEQIGNAVPPLLAAHVLAMAAGIKIT